MMHCYSAFRSTSGQTPQTTIADGRVNLRVDSVLDHEVVAIDL